MIQLYLFIISVTLISVIFFRREHLFEKTRLIKLKKTASEQVDEMKKEEKTVAPERFKEKHTEAEGAKKFDIAAYKEEIRRGDMAMAKKNWKAAQQHLVKAIGLSHGDTKPQLMLAKVYKESGDAKRAEGILTDLLEEKEVSVEVYEILAQIYAKKKRFKESVAMYARAIELDEKDDKKLIALGNLYNLLMRPSLAAECYRRAAELKPREVEYLFMLADSCEKDDDYDNALFTYKKILTIEPYNERAKDRSQTVKVKINEIETAINNPEPINE